MAKTHEPGVTLVELMVISVIASLVVLTVVQAFTGISQGIIATRFKSLATQLATERMETLKSTPYFRLHVSSQTLTPPALSAALPDVRSDEGNYPPVDAVVNGVSFTHYTVVERVQKRSGSQDLEAKFWDTPDTGLKQITLSVVWKERGHFKKVQVVNLLENPDKQTPVGDFVGVARDATLLTPLAEVSVTVTENASLNATTDTNGAYRVGVSAGTYTLRASKRGFFPTHVSNQVITSTTAQVTVNFDLVPMSSGTLTGSVWQNDHLVISRVCGETLNGAVRQEYVEIFNPTTWTWTVDGEVGLTFQRQLPQDPAALSVALDDGPGGSVIGPGQFYLFASHATLQINGTSVNADAVWDTTVDAGPCDPSAVRNDACFEHFEAAAGIFNILPVNGSDGAGEGAGVLTLISRATGLVLDQVGWQGAGWNSPADSETTPIVSQLGLEPDLLLFRKSDVGGAFSSGVGPAYDSGDNSLDWGTQNSVPPSIPRCTSSPNLPVYAGTPSEGAFVFADDGLSQMTQATRTGSPPQALFALTSIATGTWTVNASSGGFFSSFSSTLNAGVTISTSIVLNASTPYGFATGKVFRSGTANPLSGITISPGGTVTDASGFFRLSLLPGVHTLTANQGSVNANYTETSESVSIQLGQIDSGHILYLDQGTKMTGRITIDGTTPLPDVTIAVTNNATGYTDTALSDVNGNFTLSVPYGYYNVTPLMASGESYTPLTPNVLSPSSVPVFIATYTVASAYGTLMGTLNSGGQAITTGVLILASTTTIPASPPDINNTFRRSSALYYGGVSRMDGRYSFDLKNGTYTVSAWYTRLNGTTVIVGRQDQSNVVVAPRQTTSLDFSW